MNEDELILIIALFFALCCTSIFIIGISARFALFFWRRRASSVGRKALAQQQDVTNVASTITDDGDLEVTIELAEHIMSSDEDLSE